MSDQHLPKRKNKVLLWVAVVGAALGPLYWGLPPFSYVIDFISSLFGAR